MMQAHEMSKVAHDYRQNTFRKVVKKLDKKILANAKSGYTTIHLDDRWDMRKYIEQIIDEYEVRGFVVEVFDQVYKHLFAKISW